MQRRFLRITTRGLLISTGLALLLLFAAYLSSQYERQRTLQKVDTILSNQLSLRTQAYASDIGQLTGDLRFLASVPPVQGIVRAANNYIDPQQNLSMESWMNQLSMIYQGYLESNPSVTQVRLIGVKNDGMELVRVERRDGRASIIRGEALQAKGHRDYTQDTFKLPPGSIYLSGITLNQEHNQIVTPHEPTIRVAMPVFSENGDLFGLVIINFDINRTLLKIQEHLPEHTQLYLTNSEGDYLLHPMPEKTFGFDLGKRYRWQEDFTPQSSNDNLPAELAYYAGQDDRYFTRAMQLEFSSNASNRTLKLIMTYPEADLQREVIRALSYSVAWILVGILAIGSFLSLYWLAIKQRNQAYAAKTRLAAIAESTQDAVIGQDLKGVVTDWNPAAEQMFGYAAADTIGQPLLSLIIPGNRIHETQSLFQKVVKGNNTQRIDTLRCRDDGSLLQVSESTFPIRDNKRRVIGVAKTIQDIGKQKELELSINRQNARLEKEIKARTAEIQQLSSFQQAILNHAGSALIATRLDGVITLFNPAAEKLLGYDASEMINKLTPAAFHLEQEVIDRAKEFSAELGEPVQPGFDVFVVKSTHNLPNNHEWTYVRKDGAKVPVQLAITELADENGKVTGYLGISTDISVQVQARKDLLLANDQLLKAGEVAELGIWTLQVQTSQLFWNEKMYEMYQVPVNLRHERLNFENWQKALHPDDKASTVTRLQQALDGTAVFDPIFRVILPDGRIRFIQAAAIVSLDDEGKPREVLGINRDITEQREYEKNLREAKQIADDANLAKSEFLANMSHEIRTPMNGVLGITELLGNTSLDKRQQEYLALIRNSASILLNILNDILNISKIEAGKIELEMLPFSLDQKIGKLMKGFAPTAHGKNLEIHYYIDPKVPTWIVGDPGRVGQVIFNLVSNALKFTETGEVKLEVSLDEASQNQPSNMQSVVAPVYLRFDLTDTGIGIPAEKQKAVFEAFTQADSTTTRRFGGTGLGLKIVAELIQLMGGEIHLRSEVNQGSTFSVKIPFGIGKAESAEMLDESPWQKDPSQLQGKRCLVVDDNAINRRWLKDTLESWHCIVRIADSVTAAIDILKASADNQSPIDLLVLDKNMPELDGFQLMEMLNHQHISRPETILMLSSSDGSDDYERCKKLGIEKYIVKPVRQDEIYNAIASSLNANLNHASQITAEGSPVDSQEPLNLNQPFNLNQQCATPLHILLAEDNPINQRLVLDILEVRGHQITMVENGRQAAQQALKQHFDVILMDVQMPEMDGLEATRTIRRQQIRSQQQPPHHQTPIIGLTANALKGDRARCIDAGMNDYLTKPVDLQLLITTVEAYGNSQANYIDPNSSQNLKTSQEPLPTAQPKNVEAEAVTKTTFDLEQSLRRMQNKTPLIVRTAQLLLDNNAESINKLEEALESRNTDELVILAHTLKGAIGNLCSRWLFNNLGELEALANNNNFDAFAQKWAITKVDIEQFETELRAFLDSQ